MRVSNSDNCITNGLELAEGHSGASLLIAANNDNKVRVLDVATKQQRCSIALPWASNGASMCPIRRCGLIAKFPVFGGFLRHHILLPMSLFCLLHLVVLDKQTEALGCFAVYT